MKTIHKRRWLAPRDPDAQSYITWTRYKGGSFDIHIADCYKQCTLSFYRKKDVKKLDILIKELQECRKLMGVKGENINDD
jgi:hypothetical protein